MYRRSRPAAWLPLLDGVELAQTLFDRIRQQAVLTREHQQVVLLLLIVEEVLEFAGRNLAIGLDDDERPGAAQLQLVELGQDLHILVRNLANWVKDPGEPIDQRLIDLGLGGFLGVALDLARQVLGFLDEEALLLAVQVPSGFAQPLHGLKELVRPALRGGQELDELALG